MSQVVAEQTAVKEFLSKKLGSVKEAYASDLDAMTHEQLGANAGGSTRTPYDFTYECIIVNQRISMRLRSEVPPPMNFEDDEYIMAPAEFREKSKAIAEFKASMEEISQAFDKTDNSKLFDPIQTPGGETSFVNLAYFACIHNSYHDAQLNYLQAMSGDKKVHW